MEQDSVLWPAFYKQLSQRITITIMLDIEFTEQEQLALHDERFHHPHPRVQQKMEALWLKSQGVPHHQIARLTSISENTLRTYLNEYLEGGIESLKQVNFRRPQSELAQHRKTIEDYFRQHPPATINQAIAKIEELTGIRRSPTQVRVFLKAIGMRCFRVGVLPAKADPEIQEDFQKKARTPLGRSDRGSACGLLC